MDYYLTRIVRITTEDVQRLTNSADYTEIDVKGLQGNFSISTENYFNLNRK